MHRPNILIITLTLTVLFSSFSGCTRENWKDGPPPPQGGQLPPMGMNGGMSMTTVAATGDALLTVLPDRAQLMLNVDATGPVFETVKAAAVANVKGILLMAKENGIKATDISAGTIRVMPIFVEDEQNVQKTLSGYAINQEVQIIFKDLNIVGPLSTLLIDSKLVSVWNLTYFSSQDKKHRKTVLEDAVRIARNKAIAMAAVLERTPGETISITEQMPGGIGQAGPPGAASSELTGAAQTASLAPSGPMAMLDQKDELASPGKIKFVAKVEVVFELAE